MFSQQTLSEHLPCTKYEDSTCGGGGLFAKSCLTVATPWTVACQNPLSMGFPRREYWSGFPFPSPGDLLNPGIELRYPALQAEILYQLSLDST